MRSRRSAPKPKSRTGRQETAKARAQAARSTQKSSDHDSFLEVQAESGRRMRPVIAEHYGEAE
jgi:hypothetical protein